MNRGSEGIASTQLEMETPGFESLRCYIIKCAPQTKKFKMTSGTASKCSFKCLQIGMERRHYSTIQHTAKKVEAVVYLLP